MRKMPTSVMQEAFVYDGRAVHVGDTVNLLPAEFRKQDEEESDECCKMAYSDLLEWLGEGPFTVKYILERDGQIILYVSGGKADRAEVLPSDLM